MSDYDKGYQEGYEDAIKEATKKTAGPLVWNRELDGVAEDGTEYISADAIIDMPSGEQFIVEYNNGHGVGNPHEWRWYIYQYVSEDREVDWDQDQSLASEEEARAAAQAAWDDFLQNHYTPNPELAVQDEEDW